MKRFKRMLAGIMAGLMVVTSLGFQGMQAEAAPAGDFEEVSILTSEVTASNDASRTGEDGSWDGYIMGCSNYEGADYFKVVYAVEEGAAVSATDQVFNFQPYNTSWGGWQSNFVKIGESEQDASGNYVCYVAVDTVVSSLSDGELLGINLSYTADVSYGVQLKDLLVCTEKEEDSEDTGAVETLLAGPYAASNDASLYKEDGSYNGYLYSCFSFDGFDELKLTMTIEDPSVFADATDLYYVSAYNSSWGGWNTTAVKFQDLKNAEDGSYYVSLPLNNLQPSEGDRYGVNVEYAAAANVTAVTLTGIYAVTLPEATDPTPTPIPTEAPAVTDTASLNYVKAMGDGWNLGNSFDGVNTSLDEEDLGEEAWGNPVVTKELIQAAADKGYDSIRIPITFFRRFDEETYKLDEDWLARCKEVIQWALDEDLYVMINVHHDSWLWLEYWDGDKESEEYKKFTAIWEQYAEYFKDMPEQVCFETINEPVFEVTGDITAQDKLDMVNQAAYDAIRSSGGNNATRMVVIPTYTTNHGDEHCEATVAFIEAQNDENLIATVHYYSEWVHSAGIGKTGFDEVLWDDYTPRDSVDLFYETLQKQFLNKGIGVIVGEWGLLGYDSASQVNQAGEELKYYEYMNYYANQTDVCLMFWDNGSGISRTSGDYSWKKPLVGEMLETSMSERSAYVTDLDRVFLAEEADADLSFPLTLNGLTFEGIEGLIEGTDYIYDEASATVTLSKNYVNRKFAAMGEKYGTFAELVFKFSGGADWHEYLIKYAEAVASETSGTVSDIKIPVDFKGSEVRRATAYMASGKVGPNSSWWDYLQYGGAFLPDYETGTIAILSGFWDDPTVVDGAITFHFEMYDGSFMKYTLEKDGENVIGYPALDASEVTMEVANEICVYVGETEIKDTYFNIPKGTSVYGTYTEPADATDYITLTGWPATMTFGTKAQEGSIKIGLMLTYQDRVEYPGDITFWLKDAPSVEAVTVDEKAKASVTVKNLADTAVVTYEVEDTAVATVAEDGTLTGVEEGTTKVIATVTQYGRTDSFEASVTVTKETTAPEPTEAPTTEPTEAPAEPTEAPTTEPTESPEDEAAAKVKAFVERMYTKALERDAEETGVEYWVNSLISKERDAAGISVEFLLSAEFIGNNNSDAKYIKILYSTFFDRDADEGGLAYWGEALANGTSRGEVLAGFVNSDEFFALCAEYGISRGALRADGSAINPGVYRFAERLYTTILERSGEKVGIEYWTFEMDKGYKTPEDAAINFFWSGEYLAKNSTDEEYVATLYRTFMNRVADVDGMTYWKSVLSGGTDRQTVLLRFADCPEFTEIKAEYGL